MFVSKKDRFSKVMKELNKSTDKKDANKDPYRISSDASILDHSSINTS